MKKAVYIFCFCFFIIFLVYPLFYVLSQSFYFDNKFTFKIISSVIQNPVMRKSILNSFLLGIFTVVLSSLIGIPLSFLFFRYSFPGKNFFRILLFLPLIGSPFVGAIGMRQILSRFGSINLILLKMNLIKTPISWIGSGFLGILILQTLHLYPIMFLNMSATLNNFDISLEETSYNLGANFWQTFRKITFPLLLPGYFAAASIIFIWAITDLGTPLVFEFRELISVQIFNNLKDINTNPSGYGLVVIILLITLSLFIYTKKYIERTPYTTGKIITEITKRKLKRKNLLFIYLSLSLLLFISLLPHISIILNSFSKRWFFTILPSEYTSEFYKIVFSHRLTKTGILNSLILSSFATFIDIFLGFTIGYFLVRSNFKGKNLLDILVMAPLVLPGIILAFGYLTSFSNTLIDPIKNPFFLLTISYSIRRLPYLVRTTYSSFQQISENLEEASYSCGANTLTTFRKIIFPLTTPGLFAGGILVFAFSLMEVSSSLILATREKFYPIAKVIYILAGRITDGPNVACALGVLGIFLVGISFFISTKIVSKKIGEFFRIG